MNARLTLPIALVAALASAAAASAAPKGRAVCNLVKDARGDQQATTWNGNPVEGEPWSSDFDIVSADVATDRTNMTAAIRLATLRNVTTDPTSPSARYSLMFVAGKQRFDLSATVGVDGASGSVSRETSFTGDENEVGASTAEGIGQLQVVVDEDRSEIRMTGPIEIFAPWVSLKPGARITGLRVWSWTFAGNGGGARVYPVPGVDFGVVLGGGGGASSSTDRADSKATYVTGSRSCVTVEKVVKK